MTSTRLSIDFGLRRADRYFRELVVPGLGRISFVRQLSWPLAALALHKLILDQGKTAPRPSVISRGIEALACKLEYAASPEYRSGRILGSRAFGRDTESAVWSFQKLRQPTNYVQNIYRQGATRALRVDVGLGFASGSRFDALTMEPVGEAMASAFLSQPVGKGGGRLQNWLLDWVRGEREVSSSFTSLRVALSPDYVTEAERDYVRSRLLETSSAASLKRQRLARAIGRPADPPDVERVVVRRLREAGHHGQANEVLAACAFGGLLDSARQVLAHVTHIVEPARGGIPINTLAGDNELKRSLAAVREAAKALIERAVTAGVNESTSQLFAGRLVAADDAQTARLLLDRARRILVLTSDSVVRGPLFRLVDAGNYDAEIEDAAETTDRSFRIFNLHSLLRDIDARGAK